MKTKIYEARKQHCELFKWKTQHIQLQAFIERLNAWRELTKAVITPRSHAWRKYKHYFYKQNDDLTFCKEVINRMQQDSDPVTTPFEKEQLGLIKAKHWLQNNISLYKLLSFLKNAHYITNKPQQEE